MASNPNQPIESLTSILVIAQDGHFRDSLVALVKTLPSTTVAALDVGKCRLEGGTASPDIVLLDLEACGQAFGETLVKLKDAWASARYVILVDNVRQTETAYTLGADYVLTRSAPASELLLAVRWLCQMAPTVGSEVPHRAIASLEPVGSYAS